MKGEFVSNGRLLRLVFPMYVAATLCGPLAANAADAPNLAVAATPTASYASGDTTVTALNDGITPRNSADGRRGTYGNWPRTGTEWVQYEWSQPVATKQVAVYWWMDGQGVGAPKACRVLYWEGTNFVPVANATGLGVAGNTFNSTSFDEVRTSKLRLEIDSDGTLSTGILEWKVYDSGNSPIFPPSVKAGLDRDVILGGKTYLAGAAKSVQGGQFKTEWSQESGPGKASFQDAAALETTATFSKAGDYVLKLTATAGDSSSSSTLKVTVAEPPPKERLDVVYTKKYSIDSPLWNARAKALIVNWIPHCVDYIERTNLNQGQGGIDNFIEAGKALRGEPHGQHKGYVFANAWVHQTVESMCIALMVDPKGDADIINAQEKMKATLDKWIPIILGAQEPDGYLQTAFTLETNRNRWPAHWSPAQRGNHEGYTAGYFIESAINHYTMTEGKDLRLYNAAKKLADCWVANIGPGKKEWFDGHQEMEQALVRFGRFVNDREGHGRGDSYIKLARFLLDSRRGGSEYDQSHLPPIKQYSAVGHAVRATYFYSGMADIAAETGDIDYESAVMSIWDDMVNKKYYVTGGIGSGETSEGFGPDYSLRNDAYCEACSSCGLVFFQYKLNLAYHDAKYADLYEETMYNALLGSTDLDAKNFQYTNPLVDGRRGPWHACPCCVGNIPRTLLMIPTWTYVKSDDGIYVNMFIGSTINVEKVAGTDVQMVQKTDYPWSGKIAITVNPKEKKKFSVYVRIPNRKTSALYAVTPEVSGYKSFSVNGKAVTPKIEKGYAVVTRDWVAGDHIELELPMEPQRITADSNIKADQGRTALRLGPLIYNVERADQADLSQPLSSAPIKAEWKPDLLDGVMVLDGSWENGKPMVAVPNFARLNRVGEVSHDTVAGDPNVNYAPGTAVSGTATGTNSASGNAAAAQPQRRNRRNGDSPESIVWMKD
jgi:DUF1680 family protein